MGKRLVSLLGGLFLGAASLLPNEGLGQQLKIANYIPNGVNENVSYVANGTDATYVNSANNFQIYDINTFSGNTNSVRNANISSNKLFKIVLAYQGTIANGIVNKQRVSFVKADGKTKVLGSSFPSNTLVTYKVMDKTGVRTFDLAKECAAMPNTTTPFEIPMLTTSNAISGDYSTNYLSFATKESSTPEISTFTIDSGNATIRVNDVLPGENIILESKTNLTNSTWTPIATNYVGVTPDNFGTTTSTIFSNIPATGNQRFFKIRVQ
jgi:hypothetical protein